MNYTDDSKLQWMRYCVHLLLNIISCTSVYYLVRLHVYRYWCTTVLRFILQGTEKIILILLRVPKTTRYTHVDGYIYYFFLRKTFLI